MGTWSKFTCSGCGLEAEASGGRDYGMVAAVMTMVCQKCHHIDDVMVGHSAKVGSDVASWSIPEARCRKCRSQAIDGLGAGRSLPALR